MKIKRIEHVAIAVENMRDSMDMLEKTFGLKLDYEEKIGPTRLAMYPVGETFLELLHADAPESRTADWIAEHGQSLFHLCFEVEDIDGALEELRQKGVALLDETPRTGHGGARIAFLDPKSTGNIVIELAELPALVEH
ncbi:MAG: VOC family protein [Alphaproteobacteria bacterium]|nr:VOC family protein [Alphaproteobacteria bacterium]